MYILRYNHSSNSLIAFISILSISFLHYLGFYGFGSDFIHTYSQLGNSDIEFRLNEILGFFLLKLGSLDNPLSIFITGIIFLIPSFILLRDRFLEVKNNSKASLIFIIIVAAHTWPFFMSFSNVMRQGIMMGFLYFSLSYYSKNRYLLTFIFLIFLSLTHKASPFIIAIFIINISVHFIINKYSFRSKYFNIFVSLFTAFSLSLLFGYFIGDRPPSRVIGFDMTLPFLFLGLVWVISYILYGNVNHPTQNFIQLYIITSSVFLFHGLSWEYERFFMIVLFIMIVFFPLPRKLYPIWSFFVSSSLVLLFYFTYLTGMFSSYV